MDNAKSGEVPDLPTKDKQTYLLTTRTLAAWVKAVENKVFSSNNQKQKGGEAATVEPPVILKLTKNKAYEKSTYH